MTNIEKPIKIGLQMVGNRYGATGVAFDFYCSRFSNEFFELKFKVRFGRIMCGFYKKSIYIYKTFILP
ncbi:MAG: hypothetical protein KA188_04270 [Leadbetterella sp.]|nr:hypothetical protein [Leadbetterella sp.]